MSQHSSLKIDSVGMKHRNVLKRHERIRTLQETEKWGNRDSAFNLPKMKLLKIKMKKEKVAKEEAAAGAAPAAGAPAAAAPAAGAKPTAAKAAAPAAAGAKDKAKAKSN